jgi:hypothetical protein
LRRLWTVQTMAHSARTFSKPRSRNWAETAGPFDLSEHRLGQLLAQPVGILHGTR